MKKKWEFLDESELIILAYSKTRYLKFLHFTTCSYVFVFSVHDKMFKRF